MNQIIAIRYIDAFYSEDKKLSNSNFITNYSVGKLTIASKNFVVISFIEKEGIPWRGLLLPAEALIFDEKNKASKSIKIGGEIEKIKRNAFVGVYWKDLVYFENGVLPRSYSLMYTEGRVFSVTSDALIIENPETINTTPGKLANHPHVRPFFYVIPKHFITDIEIYDR